MQRLLEIPQEVYDFLRNFRLRAGDLNREGGSKTAPFTHPLPGVPAPLAGISILQQTLLRLNREYFGKIHKKPRKFSATFKIRSYTPAAKSGILSARNTRRRQLIYG